MKKYFEFDGKKVKVTRMSSKFKCGWHKDENGDVFEVTGTANDILKFIKKLESVGYISYHTNKPIMRTGRIYSLYFEEGETFYHVARVA